MHYLHLKSLQLKQMIMISQNLRRKISVVVRWVIASVLSAFQFKPTYNHTYFHKTLDLYSSLYREFSSENFDYYGITGETLCSLCKLGHNDEKNIEDKYKAESYFIKCEQHEI